jgi:hypothetical protein
VEKEVTDLGRAKVKGKGILILILGIVKRKMKNEK